MEAAEASAKAAVDSLLDQIEAVAGPIERRVIESRRTVIEAAAPPAVRAGAERFLRQAGLIP